MVGERRPAHGLVARDSISAASSNSQVIQILARLYYIGYQILEYYFCLNVGTCLGWLKREDVEGGGTSVSTMPLSVGVMYGGGGRRRQ